MKVYKVLLIKVLKIGELIFDNNSTDQKFVEVSEWISRPKDLK